MNAEVDVPRQADQVVVGVAAPRLLDIIVPEGCFMLFL